MATLSGNTIIIQQKEETTVPVVIKDSSGKIYTPKESDTLVLTVKESSSRPNAIIQKPVVDGQVHFTALDTNISAGYYVYDIQMTGKDGFTSTIVTPTSFVVNEKGSLSRKIDIRNYLPPVTRDSKDVQALCVTENVEFENLWDSLVNILYNQYIALATEYGLSQWEKIFGITPAATDKWVDRRFRVQTYLKGQRPYTDEKLEALLDDLCGPGGYILERDYAHYKLTCKLNLGVKSQLDNAAAMLERIVPMNIGLTVTLNYNRHMDLKQKFTHGDMRAFTHKSLREDVL